MQAADDRGFELAFVTDVEGNLAYFERFVKRCPVLWYDGDPPLGSVATNPGPFRLVLKPGAIFVFGGDAVDNGSGDLRLCKQLVDLKTEHPDRVFLIVGNRDLNKLRFYAELGPKDMARGIDEIPRPHWNAGAKSLREHLEALLIASNIPICDASLERFNTRCERLKYMLEHTLGCPDTFEFRRQELALLAGHNDVGQVSEEDVLGSFVGEVDNSEGTMFQYLSHGCVAALVGNTLFVHGAIDALTIGIVPAQTRFELPKEKAEPAVKDLDVPTWVEKMNQFLQQGLADYLARPDWDDGRQSRGGESLMALQNRAAMWGRTVVSNCYADGGNICSKSAEDHRMKQWGKAKDDPLAFEGVSSDPRDAAVAQWLASSGVRRVVVGHKPSGDSPAVCSASYCGLEVISADTSFSDTRASDNRGQAIACVLIEGKNESVNCSVLSGVLRDGREHFCRLRTLASGTTTERDCANDGDSFVGTELGDGWWVKTKVLLEGQPVCYLACKGEGRHCEYRDIPLEAVQRENGRL